MESCIETERDKDRREGEEEEERWDEEEKKENRDENMSRKGRGTGTGRGGWRGQATGEKEIRRLEIRCGNRQQQSLLAVAAYRPLLTDNALQQFCNHLQLRAPRAELRLSGRSCSSPINLFMCASNSRKL